MDLAKDISRSEVAEHSIWLASYIYAVLDSLSKTKYGRANAPAESSPEEAKKWLEEYGDLVLQINMLDNQAFDMLDLLKRYGEGGSSNGKQAK